MIRTIGELANCPPDTLQTLLGQMGHVLWKFANGMDDSPVSKVGSTAPIKSVGNSTTTPVDLKTESDVKRTLNLLSESVAARLRDHGFRGYTVQIYIRDNTLNSFVRQMKLREPTQLAKIIFDTGMKLFHQCYSFATAKPIRSMGIRVSQLEPVSQYMQMSLFEHDMQNAKLEVIERMVDDLRKRFGYEILQRGLMYEDKRFLDIDPQGKHIIHPVGFFNGEA